MNNISCKIIKVITLSLLAFALPLFAQSQQISISPASGTLLDTSEFDFAVVINSGVSIQSVEYSLNGNPANGWFGNCMSQGITPAGHSYFICRNQSGADFGLGLQHLNVTVQLSNGTVLGNSVQYNVVETVSVPTTIFELNIPANQAYTTTHIYLEPDQKYEITAEGIVNLWPNNPSFSQATPAGNGTTCNYSSCPIQGGPTGALVAKTNNGPWFIVKDRLALGNQNQPSPSGNLTLSINDHMYQDNIGSFKIKVSKLLN